MTKNMGTLDRALRVIVGLALLAYAMKFIGAGSSWSWIGWIGVVPLATALIGWCGAYSLFGISTCPVKRA